MGGSARYSNPIGRGDAWRRADRRRRIARCSGSPRLPRTRRRRTTSRARPRRRRSSNNRSPRTARAPTCSTSSTCRHKRPKRPRSGRSRRPRSRSPRPKSSAVQLRDQLGSRAALLYMGVGNVDPLDMNATSVTDLASKATYGDAAAAQDMRVLHVLQLTDATLQSQHDDLAGQLAAAQDQARAEQSAQREVEHVNASMQKMLDSTKAEHQDARREDRGAGRSRGRGRGTGPDRGATSSGRASGRRPRARRASTTARARRVPGGVGDATGRRQPRRRRVAARRPRSTTRTRRSASRTSTPAPGRIRSTARASR